MASRTDGKRDLTAYTSGLIAALWVILAFANPENTYHAAPVLVAAAFPVAHRFRHGPMHPLTALGAGFGGFINVAVVAGGLTLLDKMQGRSLLPGGPAVEAIILGAAGAAAGAVIGAMGHIPRKDEQP